MAAWTSRYLKNSKNAEIWLRVHFPPEPPNQNSNGSRLPIKKTEIDVPSKLSVPPFFARVLFGWTELYLNHTCDQSNQQPCEGPGRERCCGPLPPTLAEGTEVDNLPAVAVLREVYLSPLFLGAYPSPRKPPHTEGSRSGGGQLPPVCLRKTLPA